MRTYTYIEPLTIRFNELGGVSSVTAKKLTDKKLIRLTTGGAYYVFRVIERTDGLFTYIIGGAGK